MEVFIENDRGSLIKRNYDLDLKLIREDRVLLPYPYPYGFVLGTRTDDGEGVDCYVITREPLKRGSVVEAEPAGLLVLKEDGEEDHKIIAVQKGCSLDQYPDAVETIRKFILGIFARHPNVKLSIGDLLSPKAAQDFLAERSTGSDKDHG